MGVSGCTEGVTVTAARVRLGGSTVAAEEDRFADRIRPHLPAMAALAARLAGPADRDDVVQEALARAWRKRGSYDPDRGTWRVWLLAIVADRARRHRVRRREHVALVDVADPALPPVDAAGVDLERALASLPPRMRMAVDCHYMAGLTVAETAAVMGVADGTVKSALADARARLRPLLEVRT